MSPEERAAGVKVLKDMNFRDAIYLGSFKDRFMEQVRAPVGGWCRWRLVVVAGCGLSFLFVAVVVVGCPPPFDAIPE